MDSQTLSTPCSLNDRLYKAITCLLCFAPVLAVFSGLGLAPLYTVVAVLSIVIYFCSRGSLINSRPFYVAIGMLLWGVVTASWAISSSISLMMVLKLSLLFIGGFLIFSALRGRYDSGLPRLMEGGLILALALLLIDRVTHGYLSTLVHHIAPPGKKPYNFDMADLNRGATVIAVFIWPVLWGLIQRGEQKRAWLLWLVTFAILISLKSLSAVMGIAAGSLCFMLAVYLKDKLFPVLIGFTLILIAVIPFVMLSLHPAAIMQDVPKLPESSEHRLYIWQFVSHKALLHPLRGWGLDSSRIMPILPSEMLSKGKSPLPLHPHNSILQLWLELGVPGLLFFAAFTSTILCSIRQIEGEFYYKVLCASSFMAYLVIGLTAFGIWQEWWMSAGFLAAIALQGMTPTSTHRSADRLNSPE